MNARLSVASSFVVASLLAPVSGHEIQGAISADEFSSGSVVNKTRILSTLATHRASTTTPAELRQLLVQALKDPDDDIRKRALSVVASRAGGPRLSAEVDVMTRAKNELPHLTPLRALVLARFSDTAAEVREEAVLAIGSLDAAEDGWGRTIRLKPDTVEALIAALRDEVNHRVRVRLVESLAVSTNMPAKFETWWPDLFRDSSSSVRFYVVRGARKLPDRVALSLLVNGIRDPESRVRLESAQVIAHFKAAAWDLIPTLLAAADTETDPIVKKTLHGTIELLRAP